jgi:hypothetical protein
LSDYSGILKETGRATHDEMRRLKLRLEFLERYRGSVATALSKAHTEDGGIGDVPDIYLRLDASNDPVTGDLLLNEKLDVRNVTTLDPDGEGILPLLANVSGVSIETLAPDQVSNPALILAQWMEADDFAQADNTKVAGWAEKSVAYGHSFVQNTDADRPHFRTNLTPQGKPGVVVQASTSVHMDQATDGEADWIFGMDGSSNDVNSAWICVYRTSATETTSEILVGAGGGAGQDIYGPGGGQLGTQVVRENGTFYLHPTSSPDIPDPVTNSWHCVLMWYDGVTDGFRYWYDGEEYGDVNPLTQDVGINYKNLFQSVTTGGTTSANVGLAMAAMVMYSRKGNTGTQITLAEAQKVHDYLALEYLGEAYAIGAAAAGNYIARFQSDDADKVVMRGDGKVGIGVDPPLALLHVNGTFITEGNATFNGERNTFSGSVSTGDLTCVDLDCLGQGTFTNSLSTWKLDVGSTMEVLGASHYTGRLTLDTDMHIRRGGKVDALSLNHDGVAATNTATSPRLRFSALDSTSCRMWLDTERLRIADNGLTAGAIISVGSSLPTVFCVGSSASAKFGISDSTPSFKLDVNGDGRFVTSLDVDGPLDVNDSYIELDEISAPATPATGHVRIYVDSSDGILKRIDDAGSSVSLEDVGGGGGGTARIGHWMVDLPLDTPGAQDDDFSTTSLTANQPWQEDDPSGNHTYSATEYGLYVDHSGNANTNLSVLTIPKPSSSTTYTVIGKFAIMADEPVSTNGFLGIGPCIMEDRATMGSAGIGWLEMRLDINQTPDRLSLLPQNWGAYNSFSANLGTFAETGEVPGSAAVDIDTQKAVYLRIRKLGTTYGFDYSCDGRSWRQLYSGAVAQVTSNDTHVGICSRSNGTPTGAAICEWFRVIDGTAAFLQRPTGKRLDYLE